MQADGLIATRKTITSGLRVGMVEPRDIEANDNLPMARRETLRPPVVIFPSEMQIEGGLSSVDARGLRRRTQHDEGLRRARRS